MMPMCCLWEWKLMWRDGFNSPLFDTKSLPQTVVVKSSSSWNALVC